MKSIIMIRATDKFKKIMDTYKINNNKKLYFSKINNSLNNLFVNDLDEVKRRRNFSDKEYMINEIKNESKIKSEKKNREFSDYDDFIKNDSITKDIFFYYKNKINENNNENKKKTNNLNLKLLYTPVTKRINSSKRSEKSISSVDTKKSKDKKSRNQTLILPLICSRNINHGLYKNISKSYISDDDNSTINLVSPKSEKNEEINYDLNKNENDNNKNNKK